MNSTLLTIGSILITVWGIAHIFPTKSVVGGFEPLTDENRKIITMEWVAEGLTLMFVGTLVLFVSRYSGEYNHVSALVCRISAGALIVLALLSLFTGARTSIIPMKLCPLVKTVAAILFWVGSAT